MSLQDDPQLRPTISVVIPAFNVENYIAKCLDSLLSQAGNSIEILVVDDGSSDSTPLIVAQIAQTSPCIRLIKQDNAGVVAARDTGLAQSIGEWITFVDADDWVDHDFLSSVSPYLEKSEADMIQVGFKYVSEDRGDALVVTPSLSGTHAVEHLLQAETHLLLSYISTSIWSKFYRRRLAIETSQKTRDLKINHSEDILFATTAFLYSRRIHFSDKAPYNYLQRTGSTMHSYNPHLIQAREGFMSRMTTILNNCEIISKEKKLEIIRAHQESSVRYICNNILHYAPNRTETRRALKQLNTTDFYRRAKENPRLKIRFRIRILLTQHPGLFFLVGLLFRTRIS